ILIHLHYITFDYQSIVNIAKQQTDLKDEWTHYRIAKAYEHLGQLDPALTWMGLIQETSPNNTDFMLQYASMLIKNKSYSKAEKILTNILKEYTKNAEALALMGIINLNKQNLS